MLSMRILLSTLLVFWISAAASPALAQEGDDSGFDINFDSGEFEGFGDEGFEVESADEVNAAAAGIAVAYLGFVVCMSIVSLAFSLFVAYSQFDALNTVPTEYRQLEPWVPWLIFVPVVGQITVSTSQDKPGRAC